MATFADAVIANLAKNRLERLVIRAFLANEEIFDMDWLLGNAIGWIRLEVGDQDADAARSVLKQHEGIEASSAVGADKVLSIIEVIITTTVF